VGVSYTKGEWRRGSGSERVHHQKPAKRSDTRMFESPLTSQQDYDNAARLRAVADAVDEQARRLELRIESIHFEGPAARRFRAAMADRHQRAQRTVHRLNELADRLSASSAAGH
jgi:uncharacterized protein YukE